MSAIVLSGGRILGTGGGIFAVGGSSPPPPPVSSSNVVKFRSGMYMQSGNPNDQASMNAFSTSWAGNGGACQGYSAWYKWNLVETALGVYSFTSVFNDYAYLQSVAPGASFVPQFNWYANQMGLTPAELPTFNPASDGVPNYILNNPSTYGAGPPTSNSSYGGWCCDSYESTSYNYVRAAYWRTAVQARIEALFQAFGSTIVPDGQGFTVDEHPLFEMVGTSTPTDLDMQTAPNIAADYTYELANQAWLNMLPSLRATMPHTGVFIMPGFGANNFSGGNDPTQQNTLIKAMLTNGIAQSCTDVYTPTQLTYAQNYLVGNNYNGSTGFQTPLLGQIDSTPSVQGDDYPLNAITEILNCSFVTLQASRVFLYSQSSANFNIPGFWNTIIGTINSYSIPTICGELPTMYMIAPQNFVAASTTASSVTLTWTPQTTQTGTNLVYKIYRNGSLINVTASTSVFTYTDSGLSANTAYTYTINLSNANGAGPQSTYVATTAVFNYANFSGSPSTINLVPSSTPAVYSGGNILFANASAHFVCAAWYKTQQNISGGFSTSFAFTPSVGASPVITGLSFVIQDVIDNGNPFGFAGGITLSCDANMAGIGAYDLSGQYYAVPSVEVVFIQSAQNANAQDYKTGGLPSTVGLYLDGGSKGVFVPEIDMVPCGINLYSGHQFACTVVYDSVNLTLTLVIEDTTTLAQGRYTWPVNIPTVLGGNLAYIGFTYGDGPDTAVSATVNSWNFYTGINTRLATPTFSPVGGSYGSSQTVTISYPAGSTCYYTTNGLPPTSASTLYTGPITVSANEYVQAVAIQSGYTDSFVGGANYLINAANTINFGLGFASAANLITLVANAEISSSQILLTNSGATGGSTYYSTVGAAWYVAPVNIASFSTTFQISAGNMMTFCIQNQPPASSDASIPSVSGGPFAIGGGLAGLGYSQPTGTGIDINGFLTSIGVSFKASNNSVGLYTDGALPSGSDTTISGGVNLNGSNAINVTLGYDGTTLSLMLTETVTLATFSTSWAVNIPSIVGASTAYVGFTASTNFSDYNQSVNNWTM